SYTLNQAQPQGEETTKHFASKARDFLRSSLGDGLIRWILCVHVRMRRRSPSSSAITSIVPARPRKDTGVNIARRRIPAASSVSAETTNCTPRSLVILSSREVVFTESPTAEKIGVFGGPIRPTIALPV